MEILDSLINFFTNTVGGYLTMAAVAVELILRLFPTKDPSSLIRKIVVVGGGKVVDLLEAIISVVDKIVPDRTK